jgi:predicted acylesterase/phospholipase RssA
MPKIVLDASPANSNVAYPNALLAHEAELIRARRKLGHPTVESTSDADAPNNVIGLALSGGGIRSATLSLGILQALARRKLLRHIDYLSTVSGGGYIGVFLGALFTRWNVDRDAKLSDWDRVEEALKDGRGHPISWLRENGRHLAPNGAGDLLLAVAIAVRNLFAVHVVLGTLVLSLALSLTGMRLLLGAIARQVPGDQAHQLLHFVQQTLHAAPMWWSPTVLFSAFACAFVAFPLGIAYWLVPSSERGDRSHRDRPRPVCGIILVALVSACYLLWALYDPHGAPHALAALVPIKDRTGPAPFEHQLFAFGGLLVAALSYVAFAHANRESTVEAAQAAVNAGNAKRHTIPSSEEARTQLTQALRTALTLTAVLFAIGLIDSLAQTVYAILHEQGMTQLLKWIAAGFSSVAALATLLQRASGLVSEKTSGRLRLPMQLITACAGFALLSVMVLGIVTLGHVLTWRGDFATRQVNWPLFACALGLAWAFTLLFRRLYSFVNRSSLSALYAIRLARAYLGASNHERAAPQNQALTKLLPDDELSLQSFQPHTRGGPLTLINVTVNETVAGRSQVQQRDRKGMGMAIGPAGVSVGVRHHARWQPDTTEAKRCLVPIDTSRGGQDFQVFCLPGGKRSIEPHWPSMGRWMAISGAAVSTGLGARTSIGLSLLVGLFNFRLGHWWRSGIDPSWRKDVSARSGMQTSDLFGKLRSALPVQMHLLDELFARFPGTSDADWYLSDGGHFENSGAYELIRRRARTIIVCDNGADPDRSFDDLGNLVRKARLDFGAHIRFLDRAELDGASPELREVVGSLADLGFCGQLAAAIDASTSGASREEAAQAAPDAESKRRPKRYAALAEITYEDEPASEQHWLLWLRPAVLGHEPFDVLNYQVANSTFPQQSTGDQFFDEAQWESYRRLGELMACHVFSRLAGPAETPVGQWQPFAGIKPSRETRKTCNQASLGP